MPIAGEALIVAYATQSEFNSIETKNPNTIYFITDTQKIYVGESEYYPVVNQVTQNDVPLSGVFDILLAKTPDSHTSETDTVYKSGSSLTYNVSDKKLSVDGNKVLTEADLVFCTQEEYDAMQTRTGLLYFIVEGGGS